MTGQKGERVTVTDSVEYHRWRIEDMVYVRLHAALTGTPLIEGSTAVTQEEYDRIREALEPHKGDKEG